MLLRHRVVLGFFLGLIFFGIYAPANQSSESLDLKKTLQYAIEHSAEFDSIKNRLAVANMEEKSAFYRHFPSLDLSATHGIEDTEPRSVLAAPGVPWTSQTTLSLTQNLFDNGETATKYKIAKLSKAQAELQFQELRNKLTLDIIQQYLILSLNSKYVEIQEKQFAMMTRQYQSVSKDFYQGLKTKKDFLRFKTQVNRIEIDLNTAKNNLEKSKLALLKLIGFSTGGENFNFVPIDLERLNTADPTPSFKAQNHFLYRTAELQKEINQANYSLVRRKNWPELFLTAAASYGSNQYVQSGRSFSDNDVVSWNALLTLKYNLFDWGIRSRDSEVAFLKTKIQNNDLKISLLGVDTLIKEFEINAAQALRQLNLAKELLKLEKDNLGYLQTEYRNGKVQYLDLVTGYDNLADAEVKYFSAAQEFEFLKYTSLYHQGKLYEEILK